MEAVAGLGMVIWVVLFVLAVLLTVAPLGIWTTLTKTHRVHLEQYAKQRAALEEQQRLLNAILWELMEARKARFAASGD